MARASKNLMSTHSLGIVFGPTLLRAENETGNMAVHMVYQNQIAELMLSAYDQIFSWLTDEASYWVCSHLSRCLIFLHFCKHISEIFFSFQATDASFCENLMMILCLSSKHLNKIVDNICLYVFYINPFTAMPSSTSRHTLWMLDAVKYYAEDTAYPKIALMRLLGIAHVLMYVQICEWVWMWLRVPVCVHTGEPLHYPGCLRPVFKHPWVHKQN